MDSFFKAGERGSSVGQEVRAGLTTFLAMAYIIAVNPSLLTAAGIDVDELLKPRSKADVERAQAEKNGEAR